MIILHKIQGKDFLVEVENRAPLNSEGDTDTYSIDAEKLQKLKSEKKSGNDYMSMAKEGRCEGDGNHNLYLCFLI